MSKDIIAQSNRGRLPSVSTRTKCDLRAEKPRWEYLASSQSYLRRLLCEERLDEIWRLGRDEWESQQLIVVWLKRQFSHSHPWPHPPADARIMLHWVRSGRSGIFCAMFASLSVQLFAALGVPARYMRVFKNWRHQARGNHGPMEVWSRQFGKWVILDPDLNVWFTRDGMPLGITELSRALWADRTGADIRPVLTPVSYFVDQGRPFPLHGQLPLFRHATVLVDFPKLVRDQTETNMIVHGMHYLVWVPCPAARKAMETIRASLSAEAAGYTDDVYDLCDDESVFNAPPDPQFLRRDSVHRRQPDPNFRPLDVIEKYYAKSCGRAKPCRTLAQRYMRRIGTPRPSGIVWVGDRFVLLVNAGEWSDRSVVPSGSKWQSYSPDGRRIQQGALPAGAFCDMAISNNTMWLLDPVRLSIMRWPFSTTGAGPKAKPAVVWTGSPDRRPVGITTVAGDLWIAGISGLGFSWLETLKSRSISLRPGLTISRVAPAGADRILLVDAAARTVWLVCPDTGKLRSVRLPSVCVLSDAALLPDSRLAVTDLLAGRVLFVRQDGTITGSLCLGKTARPWFCAWGGGRLAVSDYSTASLWFLRT